MHTVLISYKAARINNEGSREATAQAVEKDFVAMLLIEIGRYWEHGEFSAFVNKALAFGAFQEAVALHHAFYDIKRISEKPSGRAG